MACVHVTPARRRDIESTVQMKMFKFNLCGALRSDDMVGASVARSKAEAWCVKATNLAQSTREKWELKKHVRSLCGQHCRAKFQNDTL